MISSLSARVFLSKCIVLDVGLGMEVPHLTQVILTSDFLNDLGDMTKSNKSEFTVTFKNSMYSLFKYS